MFALRILPIPLFARIFSAKTFDITIRLRSIPENYIFDIVLSQFFFKRHLLISIKK